MGNILLQSKRLLYILKLVNVTIDSTRDIQHIFVILKMINVRSMVVYTKWRTTNSWLGVTRPILSLILLERPL